MGLRNGDRASPAKADVVKSREINREASKKLLIQLYKETGESVSVSISPSGSWMLSVFVGGSSVCQAEPSPEDKRSSGGAAFCPHASPPLPSKKCLRRQHLRCQQSQSMEWLSLSILIKFFFQPGKGFLLQMAICNLQLKVLTTLQIIQHLEESMILFNGMTLTSRYCIFPLSQKIFLHVWCGKRPGMGFLLQMAICARQLKVFESHPESFRAFYSFRLNREPPIKHIKIILKWWEDKYVRLLGLTSNYTVI